MFKQINMQQIKVLLKRFRWTLLAFALVIVASWIFSEDMQLAAEPKPATMTAIFAGGCFWCMEPPYDKLSGVIATISGYTGGHIENPSYKQVSSDTTGHYEAVEIKYDPTKIDYETLLNVFWHNVDPLDQHGQFCDKGKSYRTAIFYQNETQKQLANASLAKLSASTYFVSPIVTEILPAKIFYPAEEYHQDYYQKNPLRYKYYRFACGRDNRLKELWKDAAGKAGPLIPETVSN